MLLNTQVTKPFGNSSFSFKSAPSLTMYKLTAIVTGKCACSERFTVIEILHSYLLSL